MRNFLAALCLLSLLGCENFASTARSLDVDGNEKLSSSEIATGLVTSADDSPKDGKLSEDELRRGFIRIGLLQDWDADDDHRVTALDFVLLFPPDGDLENRFKTWDKDGNGMLTNAELAKTLFIKFDLDRNDALSVGEVEQVLVFYKGIVAYDKDGDGELNWSELAAVQKSS